MSDNLLDLVDLLDLLDLVDLLDFMFRFQVLDFKLQISSFRSQGLDFRIEAWGTEGG